MSRLFHPGLSLAARVALGAILLWASWHKVADPPDFANVLYHYKLFPEWAINPLAIFVPWIEVAAGLALVSGVGRRGASILAMLFFVAFIAFLSINLARGCPTVCGCFDTFEAGKRLPDAEKFYRMKREIAVDAGCFLLALHVLVSSLRSRAPEPRAR